MPPPGPPPTPWARLSLAVAAVLLFLLGYVWGNRSERREPAAPPAIAGVLVRPAPAVTEFSLRDGYGRAFTAEDLAGRWTLLGIADPHRAPGRQAIGRLVEIHNRLAGDAALQSALQPLLATRQAEPPREEAPPIPSPLPAILFAEPAALQRLRAALGAPPVGVGGAATATPPLYLIDPSARLVALFPGAQEPQSIASDLFTMKRHDRPRDRYHD